MKDAHRPAQNRTRGRLYQGVAVVIGLVGLILFAGIWNDADGLMKALVGLLGFAALAGVWALYNTGTRHLEPDADAVMAADPRAPVLYLRSFEDDHAATGVESALCEVMDDVGPFVAVGRPGDRLPPLGASRSYQKDENWQRYVSGILDKAALVVMLAGRTEGLQWELGQCGQRTRPERVIVLVPNERAAYEAFARNANDSGIPIRLPPYPKAQAARFKASEICGLIYFDRNWQGSFSPFERALLKGSSHEWSSSTTRSRERLRLALTPVAAATGLPIRQPRTNFLLIGVIGYLSLALVFLAVMAWLVHQGILK